MMQALAAGGAPATETAPLAQRVAGLAWDRIAADLDGQGFAVTGPLLTPTECGTLAALYDGSDNGEGGKRFRSTITMARHGFGRGEYRYFAYPLPEPVATLRRAAYPHLAPIANTWAERFGQPDRAPGDLDAQLARCHAAGQLRPTPLLLRYGPGDYNCLHQDLYGPLHFPLQLAVLLSRPGADFDGGELVLIEQRPRMQSRAHVVALQQGEAAIFAVNRRPARGTRGDYGVTMRHGVSTITSGQRHVLGIIFHDAA